VVTALAVTGAKKRLKSLLQTDYYKRIRSDGFSRLRREKTTKVVTTNGFVVTALAVTGAIKRLKSLLQADL
jgi:hypothetical protein